MSPNKKLNNLLDAQNGSLGNHHQARCAFCPTCGSRLWHELDPASETISIKGGSFDKPLDVSNVNTCMGNKKITRHYYS